MRTSPTAKTSKQFPLQTMATTSNKVITAQKSTTRSVPTTIYEIAKPTLLVQQSHVLPFDSGLSTTPSKTTTTTKNVGGGEGGVTLHFDIFP